MKRLYIHHRENPNLLIAVLLLVAVVVVYRPVGAFDFIGYDDKLYITANTHLHGGLSWESIAWAFTINENSYWHPLTWISHMLDCQLFGLNPGLHHLTNLVLHTAISLLLFFTLTRMTGSPWKSATVAGIFALHPINVETVAWVAARKNVLSTFFGVLTLWLYAGYVERATIVRYCITIFTFALGLMTKPMLVTLPFVLLLLDYWPLYRFQTQLTEGKNTPQTPKETASSFQRSLIVRLVLEKVPFLLFSAASIYISFLSVNRVVSLAAVPAKMRVANALISYFRYMGKMIWPSNLTIFYPFPETFYWWKAFAAGFFLLSISVLFSIQSKQRPYLGVGWLWFVGTLVPVSGLVQADLWPAMADRFAYVPLIGLFILIVWGVSDILAEFHHGKAVLVLSACTILVSLMIGTGFQLRYWKNGITLFEHAIKVNEKNLVAHNNLGIALLEKGRVEEAVFHFKEIFKRSPEDSGNLFNLGNAMRHLGNIDQSVFYFKEALKINPEDAKVHNNLGNVLFVQGHINESIFHFEEVLRIRPESSDTHNNLANVIAAQGRIREAVIHYHEALRINPENKDAHYNLGSLLLRQKRYKKAGAHFAEAIKIDPTYAKAYNKIGIILTRQGKLKKAGIFFSRALDLDPSNNEAREHRLSGIESNP